MRDYGHLVRVFGVMGLGTNTDSMDGMGGGAGRERTEFSRGADWVWDHPEVLAGLRGGFWLEPAFGRALVAGDADMVRVHHVSRIHHPIIL